ncbi:hypothetical protein ACNOYE_11995 [Nannocystaceae bacterium ST9]
MTAEVCVLNRAGVALAADSAVTISGPHGFKIYNSGEKLFLLSEQDPVAVMINGNGNYVGVPWELVIKVFRAERRQRHLPTIEDYATEFLKFLANNDRLFPADDASDWLERFIHGEIERLARECESEVADMVREKLESDELDDAQIHALLKRVWTSTWTSLIVRETEAVRERPIMPGMSRVVRKNPGVGKFLKDGASEMLRSRLREVKVGKRIVDDFCGYLIEALRRPVFGSEQSGLVLVGFGKDEVMPHLREYAFDGYISGRPRYVLVSSRSVGEDFDAAIIPFAQTEVMESFYAGIDPHLFGYMRSLVGEACSGLPNLVVEKLVAEGIEIPAKLRAELGVMGEEVFAGVHQEWMKYQAAMHRDPILNVLQFLPKNELASFAEALVSLTSFKRRVSTDAETVGGPVDVAVITKNEGFVWIQRKHYFPSELNPRFTARYGFMNRKEQG